MQLFNVIFTIYENVSRSLTACLPLSVEGHGTYSALDSRVEGFLGRPQPRRNSRCQNLAGNGAAQTFRGRETKREGGKRGRDAAEKQTSSAGLV